VLGASSGFGEAVSLASARAGLDVFGVHLIKEMALRRNPRGRLTTPEDVARVIVLLSHGDADWISGTVIGVDGGEDIVG
jgi:NAD(P)-dependent dehydrogenase (short-subunit alcohol dehydrogenase family)